MSVVIETIVSCDGGTSQCEGNDWSADSRHLSAAEQRSMAQINRGWKRVRGKDYCQLCWDHLYPSKKA